MSSNHVEVSAGLARRRASSSSVSCRDAPPAISDDELLDAVKTVKLQSFDDLAFTCFAMVVLIAAALCCAGGPAFVLPMLLSWGVVLTISLIQPYAISITSQPKMIVDTLVSRQVYDLDKIASVGVVRNFEGGWKIRLLFTDGKIRHLANINEFHELLAALREASPSLKIDPWAEGRRAMSLRTDRRG